MTRFIGRAGLELIKGFETLQLHAYLDRPGGVWTIGYGHTQDVHEGDRITEHQAEVMLRSDLENAERCVSLRAPSVTQNQFDALVSLVFNIGCGQFDKSTLLRLVRNGDLQAVAGTPGKNYQDGQFARWNHDDGIVLDGLTRRRRAEAILFATPDADFTNVISGVETTANGGGSDA
jgi:lysozyme